MSISTIIHVCSVQVYTSCGKISQTWSWKGKKKKEDNMALKKS